MAGTCCSTAVGRGKCRPSSSPGPGPDSYLHIVPATKTCTVCKGRAGSCPESCPPCRQGLPSAFGLPSLAHQR